MDFIERLAELNSLKAESRISEDEYTLLVSLAQKESQATENSVEKAVAFSGDKPSSMTVKSGLIAVGVIVLAVVGFRILQPGDPIESKEYKDLITQKAELITKKTELETQIAAVPDVQAEIDESAIRVERWKEALTQIEGLG